MARGTSLGVSLCMVFMYVLYVDDSLFMVYVFYVIMNIFSEPINIPLLPVPH